MRVAMVTIGLTIVLAGGFAGSAQRAPYRSHTDTYAPPHPASLADWNTRAAHLRERVLASAGLMPMPDRSPLNAAVFDEVAYPDYIVSKVHFESFPGFLVTGNLYRPIGAGPFPAILSPHGHWAYGRLENSVTASVPGRSISLARQGFVVFTYDMAGYNDSRQIEHRLFGGQREKLWGLSVAGLQLLNGIRSLDFLESLPYVRADAIGATGASGGGTQVFLLAAVDQRVRVAAPVNMISLHMQGGCVCENQPGLRLDTTNVELAATIAPRPLLMVSATGDWTANTMEREYPAVRSIYSLMNAADRVHAVRFEAPHNYNRDSREAVYAWMARWLQNAPADVRREERAFTPPPLHELLVFHQRPVPQNAVNAATLTTNWIAAAQRQLAKAPLEIRAKALRHALVFADESVAPRIQSAKASRARTVLVTGGDAALTRLLRSAGFTVVEIALTPFDAEAAAKIPHFDTYNRTEASQHVADIVSALRGHQGAALVASGAMGPAALLATAIEPNRRAILDMLDFDAKNDDDFLETLYIPGIRRAGDVETAASMAGKGVVMHNGNLSAKEIVGILRARP